jgi:hypothetical protein
VRNPLNTSFYYVALVDLGVGGFKLQYQKKCSNCQNMEMVECYCVRIWDRVIVMNFVIISNSDAYSYYFEFWCYYFVSSCMIPWSTKLNQAYFSVTALFSVSGLSNLMGPVIFLMRLLFLIGGLMSSKWSEPSLGLTLEWHFMKSKKKNSLVGLLLIWSVWSEINDFDLTIINCFVHQNSYLNFFIAVMINLWKLYIENTLQKIVT